MICACSEEPDITIDMTAKIWDEDDLRPEASCSYTLPVLHINILGEDSLRNNILSRNLRHKEYFSAAYWVESSEESLCLGSESEPLPLEIKARGNFTRLAYAKKPYKIKLAKKQQLIGLAKEKHFALLPHADDYYSYLRNFVAFNLGRRIRLPWTPSQEPVELVINGDYRGLYFLTESVRVSKNRINISELNDGETDRSLITGGYLVELDNYKDGNHLTFKEKSFVGENRPLYVTAKSPENYSSAQRKFVQQQFNAMIDAIGECSDTLWRYMDIRDAARYYIVMEIIGHTEAFGGSTFLFRDRGDREKWHFSPLWDCGHAFEGPANAYFFSSHSFVNHWIESMCMNGRFRSKVREMWMWFMSTHFDGLYDDIDDYTARISAAAIADRKRWAGVPSPDGYEAYSIADNSDISRGRNQAVNYLRRKIEWMKAQYGDYTAADE